MTGLSLLAVWASTATIAGVRRGNRFFAVFVGVLFGLCSLSWAGLFLGYAADWVWLGLIGQVMAALHFVVLSNPRLRPLWYRATVSVPGLTFMAGSLLALPWAFLSALGLPAYGWQLPFVLGAVGAVQSFRNPERDVALSCDGIDRGETVTRLPRPSSIAAWDRTAPSETLRIAQITDPHLGPFMSPERLRRICERAAGAEPDLVLVTGDLLTMESQRSVPEVLAALEPLRPLAGRTFFCFGNHDHEDRASVREVVENLGATLLVDEWERVSTRVGPIDVIGADWRMRGRQEHLTGLFASIGASDGTPRVLMLHDPGAFKYVPNGAADLTLSGHTHGGHVGLVSLGLNWTMIGGFGSMPDHGYWSKGTNRLYVHRGTGHYGFPVRLGVPGEEGMLEVEFG